MRTHPLLLAIAAFACIATSPPPTAAPPERIAAKHSITSKADPAATIKLPKKARYLGATRFILFGVADCEIHVFVEADKEKRVQRYYWIQYEQYLPSAPKGSYDFTNYDSNPNKRTTLWGKTWWVRPRFGPMNEAPRPGSDYEAARRIIEKAGYTLPAEMMNASLVRLVDDTADIGKGRKEMIIFYAEDMAPSGYRSMDFVKDNAIDKAKWAPVGAALVERAAKRVSVVE